MESLFDGNYLWILIVTWISFGWIHMNEVSCNSNCDFIGLFSTPFYIILKILSIIVILVSLIILWIQTGFLSVLEAIGILGGVQIINRSILHKIYVMIFGYAGIGAIIPIVLSIVFSILLFCSQA